MDLERLKIEREPARRAPRRRRVPWVGLVVLLLLAGAGWTFRRPLLAQVDAWRLPRVTYVVVERSSPLAAAAVSGTAANGYVVARVRAALSADTPGRIVELNVVEGTVLKQGDLVARLYSDEFEAALRRAEADLAVARASLERRRAERQVSEDTLQERTAATEAAEARVAAAKARLTLAEQSHERAEKLVADSVVSEERVDTTRAELDAAVADEASARADLTMARAAEATGASQVTVARTAEAEAEALVAATSASRDQALATLEKTEVRAPFDGVVVLKDAEVGEVVSPNVQGGSQTRGAVATMVDFASLEVQVEVQETSLPAVHLGAPVDIFLDAWPAEAYHGRVDRIWPTANRQQGTVEVRVRIDEPDERLRPEMGARVVFRPEGEPDDGAAAPAEAPDPVPVLLVPTACLIRQGGGDAVFLVEQNGVVLRPVTLGERRGDRQVVVQGLEGGERVVLNPPPDLRDGDRVNASPPE